MINLYLASNIQDNECHSNFADIKEDSEVDQTDDVDNESDKPITVMVLGAGRGPLVRATLNAADITNSKVKVS